LQLKWYPIIQQIVLDALPEIGGDFTPEQREEWITTYSAIVATAFSKRRGYVLERCQVAIEDWVKTNGTGDKDDFPSPKDVMRCAKCMVDLRLPQGHDPNKDGDLILVSKDGKLFNWYWNSLLPKTLGNTAWGERMRHYNTISEARHHHFGKYKTPNLVIVPFFVLMYKLNYFLVSPIHAADKKAIPNSFEAFVALAYEGVAEKEQLKLARKEQAKEQAAKQPAKQPGKTMMMRTMTTTLFPTNGLMLPGVASGTEAGKRRLSLDWIFSVRGSRKAGSRKGVLMGSRPWKRNFCFVFDSVWGLKKVARIKKSEKGGNGSAK